MFKKVLIANRGEIAVRITRSLQAMGIRVAVVFSDADHDALHVQSADEAYRLEGTTSADTYLRGDTIVQLAADHGVEAIHPGYGFLSENATFAEACAAAGIVFIGPSPEVIRAMGDKIVARQTLSAAGVPVVPGATLAASAGADAYRDAAEQVGFPVMVKAAAGGGGKGMRIVREAADLPSALDSARREAQSAFGDARVFLERYIESPRHIEFQIFGDAHGEVVHGFERDCSIQRRHQKIIEEAPAPALTPALRAEMATAAVQVAQTLGYVNAGTVEFILAPDGGFYFLEVNTRLQVEHPVTELILRQDLVQAQVRVAAGEALPFTQDDLVPLGHALECRVYAEDPANGFLPSVGTIAHYHPASGPNVRVDSGVTTGSRVEVHYDPLLAKLVTWGCTRGESIARMRWALDHTVVLGVETNLAFLRGVVDHPAFQAGEVDTHFLQRHAIDDASGEPPDEALIAAALASRNLKQERNRVENIRTGPRQAVHGSTPVTGG